MTTPPDDLERLWKSQDVPKTEIDMQTLVLESNKFQSKIKRRNAGEYIAGLFVAVYFGSYALGNEPILVRVGALLIVVGTAVVVANIRLRGHAAKEQAPLDGPTTALVAWHRAELVRQRTLLRDVPRWYLAPFVPGVAVFVVGAFISRPSGWPVFLVVVAFSVATFLGLAWVNRRAARKLEEQIAKLDD